MKLCVPEDLIAEQPPIVDSEGGEEVGVLLDKVLVKAYHLGISHEDLLGYLLES